MILFCLHKKGYFRGTFFAFMVNKNIITLVHHSRRKEEEEEEDDEEEDEKK